MDQIELHRSRAVMADEDVLSMDARASLEQVGSALGFVLAFALVAALLPSASRLRGGLLGATSGSRERSEAELGGGPASGSVRRMARAASDGVAAGPAAVAGEGLHQTLEGETK